MEEYEIEKVPEGILLIIGGAEDKGVNDANGRTQSMDVLGCICDLTRRKEPAIEVITTASSDDPTGTFKEYEHALTEVGASYVGHIHHDSRSEVDSAAIEDRVLAADAVFFAGGDQLKLTSVYGGTPFIRLIRERYINNGLLIAGTSAGAMAMSTPMIFYGTGDDEMITGNVKVSTGLDFLRNICIDTHFVHRGRFVRMAQVIAQNPGVIGVGIEENTAIILRNGRDMEIVGCGVVIIINGRHSFGTNITEYENQVPISIRNLEVHILSAKQKYSLTELG